MRNPFKHDEELPASTPKTEPTYNPETFPFSMENEYSEIGQERGDYYLTTRRYMHVWPEEMPCATYPKGDRP